MSQWMRIRVVTVMDKSFKGHTWGNLLELGICKRERVQVWGIMFFSSAPRKISHSRSSGLGYRSRSPVHGWGEVYVMVRDKERPITWESNPLYGISVRKADGECISSDNGS